MRCVSCDARLQLVTGRRGVPDYARCPVCGGTYDIPEHTTQGKILAVFFSVVVILVIGILFLFFVAHCSGPGWYPR